MLGLPSYVIIVAVVVMLLSILLKNKDPRDFTQGICAFFILASLVIGIGCMAAHNTDIISYEGNILESQSSIRLNPNNNEVLEQEAERIESYKASIYKSTNYGKLCALWVKDSKFYPE